MTMTGNKNLWKFGGRFILVHVVVYSVIALIFINIQGGLPAALRVSLDFFEPYSFGFMDLVIQALRAAVIALVLYPFYDLIVKGRQGFYILLAALWGIVLLGSLEPTPGSIEGMIYLETTFLEHLLVLAAGAVQVLLFSLLFLRWERSSSAGPGEAELSLEKFDFGTLLIGRLRSYVGRFTFLHVIIYWVVGSLFYQISGYEEALATMEIFELYRPLENFGMVAVVFFGQIFRGAILALLLYPFYDIYMRTERGWLLLFGLLFGLKVLVVVIFIPTALAELLDLAIGIPEIITQTLVFSLLFFAWERRRNKKTAAVQLERSMG